VLTPLIESFSQPGDVVLDPFCGSGSTLVAAQIEGRNFLGIELDSRYLRSPAHAFAQRWAAHLFEHRRSKTRIQTIDRGELRASKKPPVKAMSRSIRKDKGGTMFFVLIGVCIASLCGLVCQEIFHRRQHSEKDQQLSDQRILFELHTSEQRASFEKRLTEEKASYEKRLTDEKVTAYKSGVAAARPFAFRSTKEVRGAWRTTSREIALAVVWVDGEIRAFAGDVGDLDAFQISPEIKEAIGTFSGAARKAAGGLAATAVVSAVGLLG
jgi:hypothetical protein